MIMEDKIKIMMAYVIVAIIAGYISSVVNEPIIAFVIALAFGIGASYLLKMKFAPEESLKWGLGKGLGTYFLAWYVIYTIFFNIGV